MLTFNIFYLNLLTFFAENYLFAILLFILCFSVIYKNNVKILEITFGLIFLSITLTLFLYLNTDCIAFSSFINLFISNLYIYNLKIFFLILSLFFLSLIYFQQIHNEYLHSFEYPILIGYVILSLLILLSSNDFLAFYLTLELQSLILYILASYNYYRNYSAESGMKYFILGAVSSGILLFGISIIYGLTGITNFNDLVLLNFYFSLFFESYQISIVAAIFMVLIGILFKLGVAPFHLWVPDVYEGAPLRTTAFFAIMPKVILGGFLIKLLFLLAHHSIFFELLTIFGFFSVIFGSFGALAQIKLKRLVAFSAINHVGFIILGISCGTFTGFFSSLSYLILYSLLSLNFFAIVFTLKNQKNIIITKINTLVNLVKSNNVLAFIFALLLFSMAGIPPLLGFYSKLLVLFSLSYSFNLVILIALVILSSISSFYYIRLIKLIFFDLNKNYIFFNVPNKITSYIISILLFINLFFFIGADLLFLEVNNMVLSLYIYI